MSHPWSRNGSKEPTAGLAGPPITCNHPPIIKVNTSSQRLRVDVILSLGGLCCFRRLAQQLVRKCVACCIRLSCNLLLICCTESTMLPSPRMGSMEIHQTDCVFTCHSPGTGSTMVLVNGGIDFLLVSCVRQCWMGCLVVLTYSYLKELETTLVVISYTGIGR